jgi:hypothetical protein
MFNTRVVIDDRSQVYKRPVDHATALTDRLKAVWVTVTAKSGFAVPDTGLGKVHPVKRPVPISTFSQLRIITGI